MKALSLIQFSSALISLLQAIIVSRLLGPSFLGVVAVVASFTSIALNFVDCRMPDIVGKLISEHRDDESKVSASILACFFAQLILGLVGWLISFVAALYLLESFLDYQPTFQSILFLTFGLTLAHVTRVLLYAERFGIDPLRAAGLQLIVQFVFTAVVVWSLVLSSSVYGYAFGILLGNLVSLVIHLALTIRLFALKTKWNVVASGLVNLWSQRRLLMATNLLGYVKMLHRGADTLLVAYVSDSMITGLYKLARSLSDSCFAAIDLLQRQFQPSLFDWFNRKEGPKIRDFILKGSRSTLSLLLLLPFAFYPLNSLVPLIFGEEFTDATSFILILTIPQILSAGILLWLWPAIMCSEAVGRYTLISLGSVLVLLYGVALPSAVYLTSSEYAAGLIIAVGTVIVFPVSYFLIYRSLRFGKLSYVSM